MYIPLSWAELPARRALGHDGRQRLQDEVGDAVDRVEADLRRGGNFGLKMQPSGAMTVIGRKPPELPGMYFSDRNVSSRSVRNRL